MNLERTTKRTKEMSKSLYDAYKNSLTFENNSVKRLDFCKEAVLDLEKYDKTKKLPLCMIFGTNFILGTASISEFNLQSLSIIRANFLKTYFEKDAKDYPNILLEYHKEMKDKSIFDAYNHYIFQMGAEEEFGTWLKNHQIEYTKFVDWYTTEENYLNPTEKNYFQFTY